MDHSLVWSKKIKPCRDFLATFFTLYFPGNPAQRKLLALHQWPQPCQCQRQLQQQRVERADLRRVPQRHLPGSQPAAGAGSSVAPAPSQVVGRARAHERRLARLVALHHGARNPGWPSGTYIKVDRIRLDTQADFSRKLNLGAFT